MGDRGGGREVKGASLKKSKKNPGSTAAKAKKAPKQANEGASSSATAPVPIGDEPYFDVGSAMISRQFDRDRDRVLDRAKAEGCCAIVQWFSDIEKQQSLADLSKTHTGFLYYIAGVHPDNVDRTNKKSHESWLEKVEEIGKRAECVGILTGLNLVRETGTHFAQESLLASACKLADKLQLPLALHVAPDGSSLERAIELLRAEGWGADVSQEEADMTETDSAHRVLIHDAVSACAGDIEKMRLAVRAGCMCMISAAGLADGDEAVRARTKELLQVIPLAQLVVGADSPWHTPQNLEDPYLRTLRNEPSNISAIIQALAEALAPRLSRGELVAALRSNAIQFFGMEALTPEQIANIDLPSSAATVPPSEASQSGANTIQPPKKAAKKEKSDRVAAAADLQNDKDSDSSSSSSYFSCQRCRKRLFLPADVMTHGLGASKSTVFKIGEEGLCSAFIFVKTTNDLKELTARTGLEVKRDNVECLECGAKLGRFSMVEAHCSCGSSVAGPAVKITAHKVDFTDGSLDAETLAARAIKEAEENALQQELDDEQELDGKGKKTKKKAKMKSENRGNFSSFRNKSFIPNATRVQMSGKGGIRALGGEENDSDEVDSEDEDVESGSAVPSGHEKSKESGKPRAKAKHSRFDMSSDSSSSDENA